VEGVEGEELLPLPAPRPPPLRLNKTRREPEDLLPLLKPSAEENSDLETKTQSEEGVTREE
jgi:hypothetical protein